MTTPNFFILKFVVNFVQQRRNLVVRWKQRNWRCFCGLEKSYNNLCYNGEPVAAGSNQLHRSMRELLWLLCVRTKTAASCRRDATRPDAAATKSWSRAPSFLILSAGPYADLQLGGCIFWKIYHTSYITTLWLNTFVNTWFHFSLFDRIFTKKVGKVWIF